MKKKKFCERGEGELHPVQYPRYCTDLNPLFKEPEVQSPTVNTTLHFFSTLLALYLPKIKALYTPKAKLIFLLH